MSAILIILFLAGAVMFGLKAITTPNLPEMWKNRLVNVLGAIVLAILALVTWWLW